MSKVSLKKKITIIDYDTGNLLSIKNAINYVGYDVSVSREESDIKNSSHLILPGVGSFSEAMKKIKKFKIDLFLKDIDKQNVFILGICLGMQLLFFSSNEFKKSTGLKILKGEVNSFPQIYKSKKLKLPNIGWRKLILDKNFKNPILSKIDQNDRFYFMHSYYLSNIKEKINVIESDYLGFKYPAIINKSNVFGFQFHPEKSGKSGLKIIKNFIELKP